MTSSIVSTSLWNLVVQVVHAGANLFHSLLSLVPSGEASPPVSFGRSAACVLMASNWLLNPRDKDQAQHGRTPEKLEVLIKWAWEACSHTVAIGLDSVFLDQVCCKLLLLLNPAAALLMQCIHVTADALIFRSGQTS